METRRTGLDGEEIRQDRIPRLNGHLPTYLHLPKQKKGGEGRQVLIFVTLRQARDGWMDGEIET